jgi:hypothetical protein
MNRIDERSALILFAKAEGYKWIPTEKDELTFLKTRINRLGLTLIDVTPTDNPIPMKELNPVVTKAGAELHEHRFRAYTKDEAIAALKFIELMTLYGYYENLILKLTELKDNDEDSIVVKTLISAQKIWNQLDTKKVTRVAMKDELERLEKSTKKMLGYRLQESEQMFFRKYLNKALKILNAYAKQK